MEPACSGGDSAVRKDEVLPFVTTRAVPEGTVLREISQAEADKSRNFHFDVGSEKQNSDQTQQKQTRKQGTTDVAAERPPRRPGPPLLGAALLARPAPRPTAGRCLTAGRPRLSNTSFQNKYFSALATVLFTSVGKEF